MRGPRTLTAALVAALLALGAASCGDDGDSDATTAAQGQGGEAPSKAPSGGEGGKPGSPQGKGGQGGSGGDGGSGDFVPKEHEDSGGGSAQFRVKGGDNSIQEFGSEAEGSQFEQAAAALHGFLDARAAEDWGAACSYLAEGAKRPLEQLAAKAEQIEGANCAGILRRLTNPAATGELRKEAAQADVGSLRVEGDRAFVIYRGFGDSVLAIPMSEEGGEWKVASLAGTPLN